MGRLEGQSRWSNDRLARVLGPLLSGASASAVAAEAVTADNKYGSYDHHGRGNKKCTRGCPSAWLGDGTCDARCDVTECAFDAGDCRSFAELPRVQNGTVHIPLGSPGAYALLTEDFGANCTFLSGRLQQAPDFVVEALVLEAPQVLLVLVDADINATNATWSAVVEATCADEHRNRTYAFRGVAAAAAAPVKAVETAISCAATTYGAPVRLVADHIRAAVLPLNGTNLVVEVAASVAGANGTVAATLTVDLARLLHGEAVALPLPGEALWGALSPDAAHAAVSRYLDRRNGTLYVAAVLRVRSDTTEVACATYATRYTEDAPTAAPTAEREASAVTAAPTKTHHPRRRLLLDSYGESLVRANRLYDEAFGVKPRRVPAHMPHLIDKRKMAALQKRFPEPWRETAKRRFRSGLDAQYAFSYMHYVMETHDAHDADVGELWADLDSDNDGELSGNEVISLAAGVLGKEPTDEEIERVYACASRRRAMPRLVFARDERANRWERRFRIVTRGSLATCDEAMVGLRAQARVRFKRRAAYAVEPTLDEIAFEMLGDDYEATKRQLDSIRARRTKFVCVNDNVRTMTPALADLFEAFFLSFFPKASRFELPPGQRNRHLRLDAYRASKRREQMAAAAGLCVLLGVLVCVVASRSEGSRAKDE